MRALEIEPLEATVCPVSHDHERIICFARIHPETVRRVEFAIALA